MMQSTNQQCNAFQGLVGIFLQSCGAPETVRELLAHMGVSISMTAINQSITNLAKEAENQIRRTGQGLLTSYAFDNLDIDLKHGTPTLERSHDTLVHLTTATMICLNHGVKLDDLECGKEVWEKLTNNCDTGQARPEIPLEELINMYREEPQVMHPSKLYSRQQRFRWWKFLHDLIEYGPEYFRQFRGKLDKPEQVHAIPVSRTTQVPMRAMDIKPSTPSQIGDVISALSDQSGVGDSEIDPQKRDLGNHVWLVFGDLLTGQHLRSLMESRSEEGTPWRRLQFAVFVMGLFHLKMACADAIWRLFIYPKTAKNDNNALLNFVGQIRPKETGKIESKPGFRQMHEVTQHVGIVLRLDAWRIATAKHINRKIDTLQDYANMKPTWEEVMSLAAFVCEESTATTHLLSEERNKADKSRDQQYENTLIMHSYLLLYEEVSHGLNYGNIRHVESLFLQWIWIFQSCGKHKYAAEMKRHLENMHSIYPDGLR